MRDSHWGEIEEEEIFKDKILKDENKNNKNGIIESSPPDETKKKR